MGAVCPLPLVEPQESAGPKMTSLLPGPGFAVVSALKKLQHCVVSVADPAAPLGADTALNGDNCFVPALAVGILAELVEAGQGAVELGPGTALVGDSCCVPGLAVELVADGGCVPFLAMALPHNLFEGQVSILLQVPADMLFELQACGLYSLRVHGWTVTQLAVAVVPHPH